jgi:hypothetical protein
MILRQVLRHAVFLFLLSISGFSLIHHLPGPPEGPAPHSTFGFCIRYSAQFFRIYSVVVVPAAASLNLEEAAPAASLHPFVAEGAPALSDAARLSRPGLSVRSDPGTADRCEIPFPA